MNSLELPPPFHLSSDSSHWEPVRKIYRRISILRATARALEAESLLPAYQQALQQARRLANVDTEEASILASENERIASALVLAELLAPLLAERLGERLTPSELARTQAEPDRAHAVAPAAPLVPPRPADRGVPGIADLIDGMLAQESARPERFVLR